jgi:hypothetical protein
VVNVYGDSEIALLCLQIGNNMKKFKKKKILINETNNGIRLTNRKAYSPVETRIPAGSYEIEYIINYIQNYFKNITKMEDFIFKLTLTDNSMKCKMDCNHDIEFNIVNSLASTLRFEEKLYSCLPYGLSSSMSLGKIQYEIDNDSININSIKVLCNIAKCSFENGQHSNSIYDFFPKISETRIVEIPINLMYYKLNTSIIRKIKIDLVDEENNFINHNFEKIKVLLRIRPRKS